MTDQNYQNQNIQSYDYPPRGPVVRANPEAQVNRYTINRDLVLPRKERRKLSKIQFKDVPCSITPGSGSIRVEDMSTYLDNQSQIEDELIKRFCNLTQREVDEMDDTTFDSIYREINELDPLQLKKKLER